MPILGEAAAAANGELVVTSVLGRRSYSADHLVRPNLIFLPPASPLFKCEGTGDLRTLAQQLDSLSAEFRNFNVFNDIDASGRLLSRDEPVLVKEIYCVLSAFPIPDRLSVVTDVVEAGMIGSWYYIRFEIPARLTDLERRALSEFLARDVDRAMPRLGIRWPIPHHVAPDGAYVLPPSEAHLSVLPVDCEAGTIVEMRTGTSHATVRYCNGLVTFDMSDVGEGVLLLDGVEQFTIRRQDCGAFNPKGVRVSQLDLWLIEGVTEASLGLLPDGFDLDCPSELVAQFIARRNGARPADGKVVRISRQSAILDAGAFGRVHFEQVDTVSDTRSPAVRSAKAAWIESVLTGAASKDLLPLLPWGQGPNAVKLTSLLLGRELAWLRAHVVSARERAA